MNDVEYWDLCAEKGLRQGMLWDNFKKRRMINNFLSNYDFTDRKILEIGTGFGVTAAILRLSYGGFHYTGIDISPHFTQIANDMFKHKMKVGSISAIPAEDNTAEDIFLFDVLEHIDPVQRATAYKELNRVITDDGRVFMNYPCDIEESGHSRDFEFGFSDRDFFDFIEAMQLKLFQFQKYVLNVNGFVNHYNFTVLGK